MSDAEDKTEAKTLLIELAEPDVNPKLTTVDGGDIDKILERTRRAITWEANTVYVSGQWRYIVPPDANGRWYRVVKGGTSGSGPPVFPAGESQTLIIDNTVTLLDAGEAQGSVYDVRAAAYEAWATKCRRASKYPQMAGINVASIFDHCVQMRDSFKPVLVA